MSSLHVVADFIGRANFVPGVVKGQEDGLLLVDALQRQVWLTGVKEKHTVGEQVTLIVRPEMIRIVDGETKSRGIVRRAVYLGDSIDYDIEVDGQLLTVVETDPTRMVIHSKGSEVGLDFFEDCIHVLPKG